MVDISFLWDGGVNILWYNILTPPQWYKGMTTSKQNPMTALLYHFDHLHVFGVTISMLLVQINFGRVGVNILWYNILTPPQWYKGMTTSKHKPMTALLYHFDHLQVFGVTISMLLVQIKFGWVGVKILWYNILTPPLQNIFKNSILKMESSDNLASTHKTFTFHRQYYSMVDLSFLWDVGGGGQYIMV